MSNDPVAAFASDNENEDDLFANIDIDSLIVQRHQQAPTAGQDPSVLRRLNNPDRHSNRINSHLSSNKHTRQRNHPQVRQVRALQRVFPAFNVVSLSSMTRSTVSTTVFPWILMRKRFR